jgi:hypothetical protein
MALTPITMFRHGRACPGHLTSDELVEQIIPFRILGKNKLDFSFPGPMLHVFLALNCRTYIVMTFSPDETFQAILLGKTIRYTFPVLPDSQSEIAGNADVKRSIWSIREDVDPPSSHPAILSARRPRGSRPSDGRVKPGHDIDTGNWLERD